MGGVKHFNVAVDTPDGSVELIKYVLEGANKEVEEGSEERKGGAGAIGKCFYSAGLEAVRYLVEICCYRRGAPCAVCSQLCMPMTCGMAQRLLSLVPAFAQSHHQKTSVWRGFAFIWLS